MSLGHLDDIQTAMPGGLFGPKVENLDKPIPPIGARESIAFDHATQEATALLSINVPSPSIAPSMLARYT